MLKGLKGILEKGLQIAAPFIGNAILPGGLGATFGSGIASLLTGNKPKDALMSAGATYLSGIGNPQGSPLAKLFGDKLPEQFQVNRSNTDYNKKMKRDNFFDKAVDFGKDLFTKPADGKSPSTGSQLIATGLPAYLSYLAAKEDASKPGPQDASEYMSATDKFYGGQFAPPPEDRRIKNLNYQGMIDDQPVYANQGGIMSAQQPIEYSAMTGQGIMGLAKGGSIDVKELETLMEDGNMSYEEAMDYLKSIQGKAKGGQVFPRRTGQIEGPGTKTSDSIPAMLSDGEFVQRTDAVNGAGVMMGAKNANEAREKGADFMYALQDKLAKMGQRVA